MLSKSDFTKHEECPVWLWLVKNRPDLLPEVTPEVQRIFDTGNEVDAYAQKLFSDGVQVQGYNAQGWVNTQTALKSDAPVLFQPTAITADGLSARADVLTRNDDGSWDLREVKSSTSAKEEHIVDVAFQRICFEGAGFKISKTFLVHLNNEYVRDGDIEPDKLFIQADITEDVRAAMDEAREQIAEAKKVIAAVDAPDEALVQKCDNPKKCDYLEYYVHGFPEVHTIAHKFPDEHILQLLKRGVLDAAKVPPDVLDRVGYEPEQPFKAIDPEGIRAELKDLAYPLCFFDYETSFPAVPPFDGLRPYQQMPFQYSLHIREAPGGPLIHKEFLARTRENPMPALLAQLEQDMPKAGTVISWNQSFEAGCNKEMAEQYPDRAEMLNSINDRMFDPMLLFKHKRALYQHSDFQKSASLKKVLPVICPELAYSNLAIREGGEASASWPKLTSPETTEAERAELARNMLDYCGRDTEAMVCILDRVASEAGISF